MKYYFKIILIFILLFQTQKQALTQSLYFTGNDNALYRLNTKGCTFEKVIDINRGFNDIAFHPNGNLYGIVGNGMLYEVDTINGRIELIHDFESNPYNSLVISDSGDFFTIGSSNDLRSFNLDTNEETYYGVVDSDAQPGGDLTFLNGKLYLGELGGMMSLISIDDLSVVDLVIDINVGQPIIGLSSSKITCDSSTIFALLSTGGFDNSVLYSIDIESQTFNLICTLPIISRGSSTLNEFLGSRSDSLSFRFDSISYDVPSCNSLIDSFVVHTSYGSGSLEYTLSDTISSLNGVFIDVLSGEYLLEVRDEVACYLSEVISLECDEISSTVLNEEILNQHAIYPNPFYEEVIIELNRPLNGEILIYDSNGRIRKYEYYYQHGNIHIHLRDCAPGIYYIKIENSLYRMIHI